MERKLNFFGHICIMSDDRLIKIVIFGIMFGIMDRTSQTGRPARQWQDDIHAGLVQGMSA